MKVLAPPQKLRTKLLRAAVRAFEEAGWTVEARKGDTIDFRVDRDALNFLVACVDETRIQFESSSAIIDNLRRLESEVRRVRNRQLIIVLSWNFLCLDLNQLLGRDLFVITLDDLRSVTSLADVSDRIPDGVDERQAYLLKRCLDYAIFVSKLYHKSGDLSAAVQWGRYAVEQSAGLTNAYLSLFNILKAAQEFEAAAELGEKMRQFRPDDPQILRGLEDLARKRGNLAEAAEWRVRLTDMPTTPRTFEDILAKQRARNLSALPTPGPSPAVETPGPERGIGRLFKAFRRH